MLSVAVATLSSSIWYVHISEGFSGENLTVSCSLIILVVSYPLPMSTKPRTNYHLTFERGL